MTGAVEKPVGLGVAKVDLLRERAAARFAETGFPTTRNEEWRFTNVAPIARVEWEPARATLKGDLPIPYAAEDEWRLFFVNGVFARGEAGGFLRRLEEMEGAFGQVVDIEAHPFAALNTAGFTDGAFLEVPRNVVVDRPIHIVHITVPGEKPVAAHPRILILVGENAQARIVESYLSAGPGATFTNAVTEIAAGEGAVVDHYRLQMEAETACHVGNVAARLGRSANFSSHSISLGGALVRNDAGAVLSEGTEVTLNGLYMAGGTQHVDSHTTIDHAKPHGTSHELYKGILDGKATAVFNGKVLVRKDAQKTDAKQTNKNLVLSDDAVIDTKPELQIFADDVRCTHGATIGQLDAESLFYLQSRGIGRQDARNLLTFAFAQDIVSRVQIEPMRNRLEEILSGKFHGHSR